MKIKNNLSLRFVVSFVLYAILIMGIFLIVILVLERSIAKEFFLRRISSEIDYFAERYNRDPKTQLPDSEDIQAYLGTDNMSAQLKHFVEKKKDGVYFMDVDFDELLDHVGMWPGRYEQVRQVDDLFFGIKTLADDKKIYLFINFDYWFEKEHELMAHTFWAYFIAVFIAIFLGIYTARQVIKPLKRLMEVIKKSDPDNMPSGFSQMFKDDEFGALAGALENSMIRIKQFIKREHQFTRDASHELRSPVTVIKGAVELLRMTPAYEEQMVEKLVKRIERSSLDMEVTIESLLWLARESNAFSQGLPSELLPLVENAIEQNRHLLSGKPVEIKLNVEKTPVISAPVGVLAIAVSNLIRNACQFTAEGVITVTLKENQIDVIDTGIGMSADTLKDIIKPAVSSYESKGFGFGLDIVNRLCTRFGWRLNISSAEGKGSTISLIFK